jgi:hypothetical protein
MSELLKMRLTQLTKQDAVLNDPVCQLSWYSEMGGSTMAVQDLGHAGLRFQSINILGVVAEKLRHQLEISKNGAGGLTTPLSSNNLIQR